MSSVGLFDNCGNGVVVAHALPSVKQRFDSDFAAPTFDASWRLRSRTEKCLITHVHTFIIQHYLKTRPAVVTLVLRMLVDDVPVGMAVYSMPHKGIDKKYGGSTWELARLFIADSVPKNSETWLIAASVRYIKKHHPQVRFLCSYADPSAGHSGTIYKAANWKFDGMTDEGRKTPRFNFVDTSTGKKYDRAGRWPTGAPIARLPRVSKYRFVYALPPQGVSGE